MNKPRTRSLKNKTQNKNRGITLIALIITIIVMLILTAVTISMSVNGGLFDYAGKATSSMMIEQEKEKINLGITQGYMKYYSSGDTEITEDMLEEEIKEQFTEDTEVSVVKNSEKEYIIELTDKGRVYLVKDNEIQLLKGIIDKSYTVTSSVPMKISNIVTSKNIEEEMENYQNYEIVGIASSIEGPYSTKTAVGNSGTLGVEGDINEANFSYTLNDFMDGDDVFYCKILINNEIEKIQKITMRQANEIKYEEDFIGFIIPEEYIEYYTMVEDERFSNGKAMKVEGQGLQITNIKFGAVCTKAELVLMIPLVENVSRAACLCKFSVFSDEEEKNNIATKSRLYDVFGIDEAEWQAKDIMFSTNIREKYYISIGVDNAFSSDILPPQLNRDNQFYFDAVIVTK